MTSTRDLLDALRRAEVAEQKLRQIEKLCRDEEQFGLDPLSASIADIRKIMEAKP